MGNREIMEMPKVARGKSTARKPLADISNGGKPSRHCKKKPPVDGDDGALDRLLLARSDLSNLINEIDELVAQAFEHKTLSKTGSQAIESFRHVLSDMHSSLKPWVSRLQQAVHGGSVAPEKHLGQSRKASCFPGANGEGNVALSDKGEPELDLIVSPSPLVSWRAGSCTVESGRQLFLLTPLPKARFSSSKSMAEFFVDKDRPHKALELPPLSIPKNVSADLVERIDAKVAPSTASEPCITEAKISNSECSSVSDYESRKNSICLQTPCLKISSPKCCVLDNPISESFQHDGRKPTQKNDPRVSDNLSSGEVSVSLASRYRDLFFGLQPTHNFTSRRKDLDETLDWFLSPPKTCTLMEPSDGRPVPAPANGALLATPMPKGFESTARKGRQAGESTLKKELWTRFEAASSLNELQFDASSVFQKTARKGFLDMLEEASCETLDSDSGVAR